MPRPGGPLDSDAMRSRLVTMMQAESNDLNSPQHCTLENNCLNASTSSPGWGAQQPQRHGSEERNRPVLGADHRTGKVPSFFVIRSAREIGGPTRYHVCSRTACDVNLVAGWMFHFTP